MNLDQNIRLDGFDGGGMMDVELTLGGLVEQLREQDIRIVVLPGLPKGAGSELAQRQEIAVAALAYGKKIGLQEASDALGGIQDHAFEVIKKTVHGG